MKRPSNLKSGDKFNRLTAVRLVEMVPKAGARWEFLCDCGKSTVVLGSRVKTGDTKSCGCLDKESKTKHGMYGTMTCKSWIAMNVRCYQKNHVAYKDYGGRGILVCDAWRNSFEAFFADMGERPSQEYTLDRIDGNAGYFKENCRWATKSEQATNRRSNVWLEFKGEQRLIKHTASEIGVSISVLRHWLDRGLTADEIDVFKRSGKYWAPAEVFIYVSDSQINVDFEQILGHDKYVLLSNKKESDNCIVYKLLIKGKRKYK